MAKAEREKSPEELVISFKTSVLIEYNPSAAIEFLHVLQGVYTGGKYNLEQSYSSLSNLANQAIEVANLRADRDALDNFTHMKEGYDAAVRNLRNQADAARQNLSQRKTDSSKS